MLSQCGEPVFVTFAMHVRPYNPPALAALLEKNLTGEVRLQEPLASQTSFRIGGPADLLVFPACAADVRRAVEIALEHQVPWTVLGNGSNVLVLDGGIRGMVLRLNRRLGRLTFEGNQVTVEAGASLPGLGRQAAQRGLSGLEFTAGVPGTVGGSLHTNAGCFGQEMGEVVESVTVLEADATWHCLSREQLDFRYRHSALQDRPAIAVAAVLALRPADTDQVEKRYQQVLASKRRSQPLGAASAGCIFRNPPGDFAGRLIEAAGCKGWRCGGAEVSEQHANFIINTGQARAADVVTLIQRVRERVAACSGIWLELEIEMMGEPGEVG
jgi:UDP-N-acetylmuramate dehydrogenase